MTAYTPAPLDWMAIGAHAGFHIYLIDANKRKIGVCWGPQAEKSANAALWAASPELLAALKQFVAQWNACGPNSEFGRYFQSVRDVAVAAIERAETLP